MCKIKIQKKALTIYCQSLYFRHCNAIDVFNLLYCLIHLWHYPMGFLQYDRWNPYDSVHKCTQFSCYLFFLSSTDTAINFPD